MTTREIAAAFKELYDADVSPAQVSKVTYVAIEQVVEWQNRPLDSVYPIVYLNYIVIKIRQDSRVINKSVFLALGINWIGPYISIHFLSLNPLLVRRRRYSRGERYPSALCGCQ